MNGFIAIALLIASPGALAGSKAPQTDPEFENHARWHGIYGAPEKELIELSSQPECRKSVRAMYMLTRKHPKSQFLKNLESDYRAINAELGHLHFVDEATDDAH